MVAPVFQVLPVAAVDSGPQRRWYGLWCLTGKVRWVLLCTDVVFPWKLPEAVGPWWWELVAVPGFLSGLRCSRHTRCFMSPRGARPSLDPSTTAFTLGLKEPGPFQHPGSLQASRTPRTQVLKSPQAVTQERDSVSRETAASSLPSLSLHLILETHSCSSPTPLHWKLQQDLTVRWERKCEADIKLWENIIMETVVISFSKPKSLSGATTIEICDFISQIKVTS